MHSAMHVLYACAHERVGNIYIYYYINIYIYTYLLVQYAYLFITYAYDTVDKPP